MVMLIRNRARHIGTAAWVGAWVENFTATSQFGIRNRSDAQ